MAAITVAAMTLAACGGDDDTGPSSGASDTTDATATTSPGTVDDGTADDTPDPTTTTAAPATTTTTTTEPPFEPEPLTIERRDDLDPDGRPWVPNAVVVVDDRIVTTEGASGLVPSVAVYDPVSGALVSRQFENLFGFYVAPSGVFAFDMSACTLRSLGVDATTDELALGEPLERVGDGRSCSGQDQTVRGDQVWVRQRGELAVFDLASGSATRVALPYDLVVPDVAAARLSILPPVDVGDAVLVGVHTGDDAPDLLVRVEDDLSVSASRPVDGRVQIRDGVVGVSSEDSLVVVPVDPVTLDELEADPADDEGGIPSICEFGTRHPGANGRTWVGPTFDTDGTPTWRLCVDEEWVAEGTTDASVAVIATVEHDGRLHVFGTDATVEVDPPAVWLVISLD